MARQLALDAPAAGTRPSRNQLLDADRPIHDWYRFVLSFPPHLVRDYLAEFNVGGGSVVLDPFCGTGTTPVEAKKLGIGSIGIEALPLSAFAARTKLDWSADPAELRDAADAAAGRATALAAGPRRTLPDEQMRLLPDRAISPLPLHKALCLRDAIGEAPEHLRPHLRLALAKNLPTQIGNLRFGPEIGLGPIREDAEVVAEWRGTVGRFAADLELEFRGDRVLLEGREATRALATEEAGAKASRIAVLAPVRAALLDRQRAFRRPPGLVADGRDMGTVVFPDSACKVFLTASPEVRARRRYNQLRHQGMDVSLAALFEAVRERDERDRMREAAPLRPARGALRLDTTHLGVEETLERVMEHVRTTARRATPEGSGG